MLLVACHGGGQPPAVRPSSRIPLSRSPASALLGQWDFVPAAQPSTQLPSLRMGLQVTLEIDSAAGNGFSGRVARWFSGDVGIALGAFKRIAGQVDSSAVTFTIPYTSATVQPVSVTGRLAADTLRIVESKRGSEPGPFAAASYFVRTAKPTAK